MSITGSALQRYLQCPSYPLLNTPGSGYSPSGYKAKRGTFLHAVRQFGDIELAVEEYRRGRVSEIERLCADGDLDPMDGVDEIRKATQKEPTDAWLRTARALLVKLPDLRIGGECEIVYSYHVPKAEGRKHPFIINRQYSEPEVEDGVQVEFFCTVDELRRDEGTGHVEIDEFKTGSTYIPSPEFNAQVKLAALAAEARSATLHITKLVPPAAEAAYVRITAELEESDLAQFHHQLEAAVKESKESAARLVKGLPVILHTGPECRYCPKRGVCPKIKEGEVGPV